MRSLTVYDCCAAVILGALVSGFLCAASILSMTPSIPGLRITLLVPRTNGDAKNTPPMDPAGTKSRYYQGSPRPVERKQFMTNQRPLLDTWFHFAQGQHCLKPSLTLVSRVDGTIPASLVIYIWTPIHQQQKHLGACSI